MSRASDHWLSYKNLDPNNQHARDIMRLLSTGDFNYLCTSAVELRNSSLRSSQGEITTCSVDLENFTNGYNNVVLELSFSDGVRWIARIKIPHPNEDDNEVEISMLSELATIKVISERTTVPVPLIFGYDVDKSNPFGYRYMLMEALPGRVPGKAFSKSVPPEHQERVAQQFADYYHQLSSLRFDRIGRLWCGRGLDEILSVIAFRDDGGGLDLTPLNRRGDESQVDSQNHGLGPFVTSLEYFYTLQQRQSRAMLDLHPGEGDWAAAAWILEQTLPALVMEENLRGPFPLCHLDLHYGNYLLDSDYNITGLIDWTGAAVVPLERCAISPEFITFPGLSEEENAPIKAFVALFVGALKKKEKEGAGSRDGTRPLSEIIGTPRAELVYRCTYTYPWRALYTARMVLRLMYGAEATWETFTAFYRDANRSTTGMFSSFRDGGAAQGRAER